MYQNCVIISAELNSLDRHTNYERTNMLRSKLIEMGLSFVGVTEHWKGQAKPLQSFLVVTKYYKPLLELARDFKQDVVLLSDNRRHTYMAYTKGTPTQKLGVLQRASKETALDGTFYLLVNEDGNEVYYTTSK